MIKSSVFDTHFIVQYFVAQIIDGFEMFCYSLLVAVVTVNIILMNELK